MNFTIALIDIILCINLNNYISIKLEKSLLTQYNDKAQTAKKNRDFVPAGTKIGHTFGCSLLYCKDFTFAKLFVNSFYYA